MTSNCKNEPAVLLTTVSTRLNTDPTTANKGLIVRYLAFTNVDASNPFTVTVVDSNGIEFLKAYSLAAASFTDFIAPPDGWYFHGGIYALASANSKVNCWVRYELKQG